MPSRQVSIAAAGRLTGVLKHMPDDRVEAAGQDSDERQLHLLPAQQERQREQGSTRKVQASS